MSRELQNRELQVARQSPTPITWEDIKFDEEFPADLIVNGLVIVELKSVERFAPVHAKQLLTYLKLSSLKLGLPVNFGEELINDGIKRIVNGL